MGSIRKSSELGIAKQNRQYDIHEGSVEDTTLGHLGLHSSLNKNMSSFEMISAGWTICVSYAGVAGTLALTVPNGGAPALLYGIILVTLFVGASAASLAELASVYPTAGGQYHWTSILAPKSVRRGLSYSCGAINVFAWISLCSGFAAVVSQLIIGLFIFSHSDYTPEPWHGYLAYAGVIIAVLLFDMFLLKRMEWINIVAFAFTLGSFLVILVTCAARAETHQDSETVWAVFVNESGWSADGVVFFIGLVSPNYMFSGIDGAIHLAEDCKNAAVAVPRALMSTVIIGFITAFPFTIVLLYCTADFDAVLSTSTAVPVYEIFRQACRSDAAATTFVVAILLAGVFALIGAQQTASRLTWSFARDDALLFSKHIASISQTWGVPLVALVVNAVPALLIGLVALGSTAAFNAIVGSGLVLQQLSFAFPTLLLLLRGRDQSVLPMNRPFKLGGLAGWTANGATIVFAVLVVIFYDFPTTLPATGSNMNYTAAVLGVMVLLAVVNWFLYARMRYEGPSIEL